MQILSRYIVSNVLRPTLLVLLVLVAMLSLFDFLNQMGDTGRYDYNARLAALYVLLYVPFRIVQLLPVATLIGTVMGLGVMSSTSELTVMRAAGVSPLRIGLATLRAALLLIIGSTLLSEFVSPQAVHYAETMRTNALSPNRYWLSGENIWLRSGEDFVRMNRVSDDGHAENIQIFSFNKSQTLSDSTVAARGHYEGEGRWRLYAGSRSHFDQNRVQTAAFSETLWESDIKPENLASLQVGPAEMTGRSLFFYVQYLAGNGLDWRRYDLEFWRKVFEPLNLFAMVLAGIASVFGPLRSVSVSARILAGVAVGLGFHFLSQVFGPVSLVSSMPPFLGALLPPLAFLAIAVWLLRRAR